MLREGFIEAGVHLDSRHHAAVRIGRHPAVARRLCGFAHKDGLPGEAGGERWVGVERGDRDLRNTAHGDRRIADPNNVRLALASGMRSAPQPSGRRGIPRLLDALKPRNCSSASAQAAMDAGGLARRRRSRTHELSIEAEHRPTAAACWLKRRSGSFHVPSGSTLAAIFVAAKDCSSCRRRRRAGVG